MNRDVKELCRHAGINEEIRITTYKDNFRSDESHPKWELPTPGVALSSSPPCPGHPAERRDEMDRA